MRKSIIISIVYPPTTPAFSHLSFPGGCVKSKNQVFFDILYKKDFISLLC